MQYFRAVNMTKQEYFDAPVLSDEDEGCSFGIERSGCLWEWCVNRFAGLFPYLLRTSSRAGDGDLRSIRHVEAASFAGRWAGDAVYLVGDYDASRLFQIAESEFTDITVDLFQEYNRFAGLEDRWELSPQRKA